MKRGLSLPYSPPSQLQFSFSSLPLPLPLLFTLPKYAQAVIMALESSHTQTYSLPQCPCPQPATGPAPQSPLLPWANESQMAACDSAVACGNPDVLPSHAPHPGPESPADGSTLLLWGLEQRVWT